MLGDHFRVRSARASIILCLGPLLACAEDQQAPLIVSSEVESVLLFTEAAGELSVEALDLPSGATRELSIEDTEADVTALLYQVSLAELGLSEGPIQADPQGRRVPIPDDIQGRRASAGTPWQALAALPASVDAFRLPRLDVLACAERGGCHVTARDPNDEPYCVVPCPASDPPEPPREGPASPEPPTPPSLTPCPEHWVEVSASEDEDGVAHCRPPVFDAAPCPLGEARLLDDAGCQRLGSACPAASGFQAALPAGRPVIYVQLGANGGDGSESAPFGSIQEAMSSARAGDVVALGLGRFVESVQLPAGVGLFGACVEGTTLASPNGGPALAVVGAGAEVSDLNVEGRVSIEADATLNRLQAMGLSAGQGAVGTVTRARLESGSADVLDAGQLVLAEIEARDLALSVQSQGSASLSRVLFRGGSLTAQDGTLSGADVVVEGGRLAGMDSRISFERAAFKAAGPFAIAVDGTSTASITNVYIEGAGDSSERGLEIRGGSSVSLSRALIERLRGRGISATAQGPSWSAEDVVIRDIEEDIDNELGEGIFSPRPVELRRALLARTHFAGIRVRNTIEATSLLVEDVEVRGVAESSDPDLVDEGNGIRMISVHEDSQLTSTRIKVSDTFGIGIMSIGPLGDHEDVSIGQTGGFGFLSYSNHQQLRRFLVEDATLVGLHINGPAPQQVQAQQPVELSDIEVTRTTGVPDDDNCGILVAPSDGRIERVLLHDNGSYGGRVGVGNLDLTDFEVRDNGMGLRVFSRDQNSEDLVRFDRTIVNNNHCVGIELFGTTKVSFTNLTVSQTQSALPGTAECLPSGSGLYSFTGSVFTAQKFLIEESQNAGVSLAGTSGADLENGLVRKNNYGVQVDDPDFDLSRVSFRVEYEDNRITFDQRQPD